MSNQEKFFLSLIFILISIFLTIYHICTISENKRNQDRLKDEKIIRLEERLKILEGKQKAPIKRL